jgi:hypothetical protein
MRRGAGVMGVENGFVRRVGSPVCLFVVGMSLVLVHCRLLSGDSLVSEAGSD